MKTGTVIALMVYALFTGYFIGKKNRMSFRTAETENYGERWALMKQEFNRGACHAWEQIAYSDVCRGPLNVPSGTTLNLTNCIFITVPAQISGIHIDEGVTNASIIAGTISFIGYDQRGL